MCKTDKKTRNSIMYLPRDKMSHRNYENWLCESELIVDLRDKNETKDNRISFLYYNG